MRLHLCLPLDGDARDESPAARDVEVVNVTFEPGRRGQAARFGPGRQLRVPDPVPVYEQALSVDAAVRPSAYPPPGQRAGIVEGSDRYGVYLMDQGDLECRTPGGVAVARQVVRLSTWTSVRCIFRRNRIEIHVDEEQVADAQHEFPISSAGEDIRIGNTDQGTPFSGLIDEVRIWRGREEPF
jgi:hypothetical protein